LIREEIKFCHLTFNTTLRTKLIENKTDNQMNTPMLPCVDGRKSFLPTLAAPALAVE